MGEMWKKVYSKSGVLLYEGFTSGIYPAGVGVLYYPNGNKYQEGIFGFKGLVSGREYYQDGQVRFDGVYRINMAYGPNEVFMIILWSNEYLESPACLSEMGAAWVTQTDYLGIYTPDFSFGNPKYHEVPIDTTKMGAVLNGDSNCRASMIEFNNKVIHFFGLDEDEQRNMYLVDEFMKDIEKINKLG